MTSRISHMNRILALVGGVCIAASSQSQNIPYRTSFEPTTFTVGALGTAGQDGWEGTGEIQNATSSMIHTGVQSLQIDETSVVTREMASASGTTVYIDGYFHGPTVSTKPDPTSMDEGSSLLLFHETEGIMALDGNGTGGGTWTATGVTVSTSALQRITIALNFSTHTWTLYIDKQQVPVSSPKTFGFKNNTINQLNGIDIETSSQGKGYLDDFSATTAVPDFFNESLFDFSREWHDTTTTGLNWDLAFEDGLINANDLDELIARILE